MYADQKTSDALRAAFVQGAAWWEYKQTGATIWQSDRALADLEAQCRLAAGTLGEPPFKEASTPKIPPPPPA